MSRRSESLSSKMPARNMVNASECSVCINKCTYLIIGQGRIEALCFDGVKRMCTIRGSMRNRVWISPGDIVLVGLRDFGDDKGDVILKYYEEEAKELKELGEIPEHIKINEGEFNLDGEDEFGMDEEEKEGELDIDGI